MRCGRSFGWRRRRHHCRLCGRFIRASCSGRVSSINYTFPSRSNFGFLSSDYFLLQTFFISNSSAKQDSSSSSSSSSTKPARACDACYDTVFPVIHPPPTTIPSLSHLPSWLSMPSLPVARQPRAFDGNRHDTTTCGVEQSLVTAWSGHIMSQGYICHNC